MSVDNDTTFINKTSGSNGGDVVDEVEVVGHVPDRQLPVRVVADKRATSTTAAISGRPTVNVDDVTQSLSLTFSCMGQDQNPAAVNGGSGTGEVRTTGCLFNEGKLVNK